MKKIYSSRKLKLNVQKIMSQFLPIIFKRSNLEKESFLPNIQLAVTAVKKDLNDPKRLINLSEPIYLMQYPYIKIKIDTETYTLFLYTLNEGFFHFKIRYNLSWVIDGNKIDGQLLISHKQQNHLDNSEFSEEEEPIPQPRKINKICLKRLVIIFIYNLSEDQYLLNMIYYNLNVLNEYNLYFNTNTVLLFIEI